jgi:tetratricopeptide (TPR) repeat protein/ubiquitin-protein ligase
MTESDNWFIARGDEELGPFSVFELKEMGLAGKIEPTDEVWKEGMPNRIPATRVKGLLPATDTLVSQSTETAAKTAEEEAEERRKAELKKKDLEVRKLALQIEAQARTSAPTFPAGEVPAPPRSRLPMRTRRLIADAEQIRRAFGRESLIRLQDTEGEPPELYRIEYHVHGLARGPDGQPVLRDTHLVEIQLTSEYPRVSPRCRVLTPIFHPNIDPSTICVGDHWAAGERLVDLVVRIGEMIAYQAYNIKSPLDGEAAMWADLNQQRLPLVGRDLRPAEDEGPVPPDVADALLKAAITAQPVARPPAAPSQSTAPPTPSEDQTQPSADQPKEGTPAPAAVSRKRGGRAVVVLMVGLIACTIWALVAMLAERSDRQAAEKLLREEKAARTAAEKARQEAEASRNAAEKARSQAVQDLNAARAAEGQAVQDLNAARAAVLQAKERERQALADKEKAERSEADTRAALAFFRNRVLAKWPIGEEGHPPSALALREAVDAAEPEIAKEFGTRPLAEAAVRDMLGRTYAALSEPARAVPQYERAVTLRQKYWPNDPRTLTAIEELGNAYRNAGKLAYMLNRYEELVRRTEAKYGPNSRETLLAWNKLGVAYWAARQFERAIAHFEKTHKAMQARFGPENEDTLQVLTNLAVNYCDGGRPNDALRCFAEARQRYNKFALDHQGRLFCLMAFAQTYEQAGRWTDAVPLHEERLKGVIVRFGPASFPAFDVRTALARACRQAGDLGRAEKLLREQVEISRKSPGPEEPLTGTALALLGHNLLMQKKYAEAEPFLRGSLTIRERKLPDSWERYDAWSLVGGALLGQKKYVDAEEPLLRGYEGLKRREVTIPPQGKVRVTDALDRLVQLYDAWDKKDKADEWRKQLKQAPAVKPANAAPDPSRAQDEKLLAVLSGKSELGSAKELIELARNANNSRERFAAVSGLFVQYLGRRPEWASHVGDATRPLCDHPPYYAAASALMAARGEGDGAKLTSEQRGILRKQALTWMREHLAFCENRIQNKGLISQVHEHLTYAGTDGWFASVRDEKQLANLPEPEQKEWTGFWKNLANLREKCKPSR